MNNFARKAAAVYGLPVVRDLGKDLIVRSAKDLPVFEMIVRYPSAAGRNVVHIAVEHGEGGGRVQDEEPEFLLALPERLLGPFAFGDIPDDSPQTDRLSCIVPEKERA